MTKKVCNCCLLMLDVLSSFLSLSILSLSILTVDRTHALQPPVSPPSATPFPPPSTASSTASMSWDTLTEDVGNHVHSSSLSQALSSEESSASLSSPTPPDNNDKKGPSTPSPSGPPSSSDNKTPSLPSPSPSPSSSPHGPPPAPPLTDRNTSSLPVTQLPPSPSNSDHSSPPLPPLPLISPLPPSVRPLSPLAPLPPLEPTSPVPTPPVPTPPVPTPPVPTPPFQDHQSQTARRVSPFTVSSQRDDDVFFKEVAEAYREYCGQTCQSPDQPTMRECFTCYCDSICHVHRDCCPDLYVSQRPPPVNPGLRCSPVSFGSSSLSRYVMITQCRDVAEPSQKQRCESSDTSDWKMTQPVTSADSGFTYKNRYCAHCYSDHTNLTSWSVKLNVHRPNSIVNATSAEELYDMVMKKGDNQLVYTPTDNVYQYTRECPPLPLLTRCNVTGQWRHYDVSVDRACGLLNASVKGIDETVYYKNPFCYLCNTGYTWSKMLTLYENPKHSEEDVPLLMLLDFTDDDEDDDKSDGSDNPSSECPSHQFFDPKTARCRQARCAPGKQYPAAVTAPCLSPFPTNMYGHQLCLHDVMDARDVDMVIHLLETESLIEDVVSPFLFSHPVLSILDYVTSSVFSMPTAANSSKTKRNLYSFRFFSSWPVDRDVLDEALLTASTNLISVLGPALGSEHLKLSPTCSPQVFQSLMGNDTWLEEELTRWDFYSSDVFFNWDSAVNVIYLPVSATLTCPAVELTGEEFQFDPDTYQLLVERADYSDNGRVDSPFFHITQANSSVVCVSQYQSIFPQYNNGSRKTKQETNAVLYWTSLLSMVVSLIFLFLSFLLYTVLAALRTIAGVNNLLLVITLFAAQLFLLISSQVSLKDWLCQVLAVVTHYLWLAVVLAQNACTFHMFYSLSFPLLSHVAMASPATMTRKYVTYVLLTSALIVVTTLVWQWAAEGNSGYGDGRCFISDAVVRIVMFGLPLAVTVLANLAMFLVTIWRMRSLQHVPCTRSKRVSLLLYTKLSVLTGVTWLFGFLAAGLDNTVLNFLFAVGQGGQGVFIFLAFLANRRVLDLLGDRLSKSKTSTTTTTTTSRKTIPTNDHVTNSPRQMAAVDHTYNTAV